MQDLTKLDVSDLPSVLRVKEAAVFLRLPLSHAYELVERGAIPCIRFGRAIRVPRQALVDLLNAGASRGDE